MCSQVHSLVPADNALAQTEWSKNKVPEGSGLQGGRLPCGCCLGTTRPPCAHGREEGQVSLSDKTGPEDSEDQTQTLPLMTWHLMLLF